MFVIMKTFADGHKSEMISDFTMPCLDTAENQCLTVTRIFDPPPTHTQCAPPIPPKALYTSTTLYSLPCFKGHAIQPVSNKITSKHS